MAVSLFLRTGGPADVFGGSVGRGRPFKPFAIRLDARGRSGERHWYGQRGLHIPGRTSGCPGRSLARQSDTMDQRRGGAGPLWCNYNRPPCCARLRQDYEKFSFAWVTARPSRGSDASNWQPLQFVHIPDKPRWQGRRHDRRQARFRQMLGNPLF
jgi:hypothetical protein